MKKLVLLLSSLAFLAACNKERELTCANALCPSGQQSLSVWLYDANQNPYLADSAYTLLGDGTRLYAKLDSLSSPIVPGRYALVDYDWTMKRKNVQAALRFRAFRSGQTVVDTPFVVAVDCCSVSKVSGTDTLIVL